MRKHAPYTALFLLLALSVSAAPTPLAPSWARTLEYPSGNTRGRGIRAMPDGSVVLALDGADEFVTVVKLDAWGNVEWDTVLTTPFDGLAVSVHPLPGGDVAVVGPDTGQALVVHLDGTTGAIVRQRRLDGSGEDWPWQVRPTSDGGIVVAGDTRSEGGGLRAGWIFKLDASWSLSWQTIVDNATWERLIDVREVPSGGFIAVGSTGPAAPDFDVLVVRVSAAGAILWQRTYDNGGDERGSAIAVTSDGGFVMSSLAGTFGSPAWITRLNSAGAVLWQKRYDGAIERFNEIEVLGSGDIVVGGSGYWASSLHDQVIARLDSLGRPRWAKAYGGSSTDHGVSLAVFPNGYGITGTSFSFGGGQALVVRTDPFGNVLSCPNVRTIVIPWTTDSPTVAVASSGGPASIPFDDPGRAIMPLAISNSIVCEWDLLPCGGLPGTPCPLGFICVDDPRDDCDPDVTADCIGVCVPPFVGGTGGPAHVVGSGQGSIGP